MGLHPGPLFQLEPAKSTSSMPALNGPEKWTDAHFRVRRVEAWAAHVDSSGHDAPIPATGLWPGGISPVSLQAEEQSSLTAAGTFDCATPSSVAPRGTCSFSLHLSLAPNVQTRSAEQVLELSYFTHINHGSAGTIQQMVHQDVRRPWTVL